MTFNFDLTNDNGTSTYIYKYKAIFESQYEMFLYCIGGNYDYGAKNYMLGAVCDGVCKKIGYLKDDSIICEYYVSIETERATGNVTKTEYGYNERKDFGYYYATYSEDDYSFNGFVFESLDAAQKFYDICDISGVIRFSAREKMFDEMPEEVKKLYFRDGVRKNIRIHFPNGERADIINDNIDGENFRFTERICSRSQLKFGLCEANVVEFTCVGVENIKGCEIEVFHEIDITSLSSELIPRYASFTTDVPYPYFRWSYGKFVVDECPRQSDMRRRKVVAYSDSINFDIKVSSFEKAKWEVKYRSNEDYVYNPAKFAICNISQNVNLDLSVVGAFEIAATSLNSKLTETAWYPPFYNSYNPSLGKDIGVHLIVEALDLSLIDYKNSEGVFAYKTGNSLITDKQLRYELLRMIEPYKERITAYDSKLDGNVHLLINYCHPFGYVRDYDKSLGTYNAVKYAYGMRNSGLIDPNLTGYAGDMYGILFPYRMTIEVRQLKGSKATVIDTRTIELFDKYSIDVDAPFSDAGEILIPSVYKTETRMKNATGEYVLDLKKMPNVIDVLKGLLELNACYLKSKTNGIYSALLINDKFGLYPSVELFPNSDLYPSGPSQTLKKAQYTKIWYADDSINAYTAVAAKYTDTSGNEVSMEYHEKEYAETYTELLTRTYVNDGNGCIEIDLSSNNPFTAGMTVYGMVEGLDITEAWTNNGGDLLFTIYPESGDFRDYNPEWTNATKLTIYVDVTNVEIGAEFRVSIGSLESKEIMDIQYKTLDLSDNYLISNYNFTEAVLKQVFRNILHRISNIAYMPANLNTVGMPWVRAGDVLEVRTREETIVTIALRRTLKGVQSLRDAIESR